MSNISFTSLTDAKVESGLKVLGLAKVESGLNVGHHHGNQQQSVASPVPALSASATCVPGVVRESLLYKLQWTSSELRGTTSVEYSIALCQLIKACSEALQSIGTESVANS